MYDRLHRRYEESHSFCPQPGVVQLQNPGQLCYANAIVTPLLAIPAFVNFLTDVHEEEGVQSRLCAADKKKLYVIQGRRACNVSCTVYLFRKARARRVRVSHVCATAHMHSPTRAGSAGTTYRILRAQRLRMYG